MRTLPVGEHALLVELDSAEATEAFHAELLRRRADGALPPVREIVPAARTVLLDGVAEPGRLADGIRGWAVGPVRARVEPAVEVPVRYDGPDLPDVASLWGVRPDEVAGIHAAAEYRVAFCGFAPGFGYLTGADWSIPRRSTPRTKVPAGAVALAGEFTGVYPRESPGGWQLIGRTALKIFDPDREPAALFHTGRRVSFVLTDEA